MAHGTNKQKQFFKQTGVLDCSLAKVIRRTIDPFSDYFVLNCIEFTQSISKHGCVFAAVKKAFHLKQ